MVNEFIVGLALFSSLVMTGGALVYKRRIREQLIQLSDALEAQLAENTIQPFSELDDVLMSKIQKQLMKLEEVWLVRYDEEKKEKERLNSLISDISHQIKTPLANIKLYDSLIETSSLNNKERSRFVLKKEQQMHKLEWLMEALIKVSKMETGMIQLYRKKQSLSRIVLNAIDMATLKAEQQSHDMTLKLVKDIYVDVDAKWMAEAIFNILDNAIKYSHKGSCIQVSTEVIDVYVRMTIEDEAEPIAQEEYTHIFKRFYRTGEVSEIEGVGLGLYMSRDIVRRHDGYIIIEEGDKGNRFSVFLPICS